MNNLLKNMLVCIIIVVTLSAHANKRLKCGCIAREGDNETVVPCNDGGGWEATVCTARPGAKDYIISIVDTGKVHLRAVPENNEKGTKMTSGSFEWRGIQLDRACVWVKRCHVNMSAYEKIFALIKRGEKCSLTLLCENDYPYHARLIGADFPKVGKVFVESKDGKVVEGSVKDMKNKNMKLKSSHEQ